MPNLNKADDWKYTPQPHDNSPNSLFKHKEYTGFRSSPYASKEVLEHIGEDGISTIDSKIKEMIQWRTTMYGENAKQTDFSVASLFFTNPKFPEHEVWCHDINTRLREKGDNHFPNLDIKASKNLQGYMMKWRKRVKDIID